MIDPAGICGSLVHYVLVILLVAAAMILFFYLWYKKRLDMDEGPKYQMLEEPENIDE